MQNLWSKATQAKTICHSTPPRQAILRHNATVPAGRQRLRFGETLTIFYSSIFATAAVIDAKRKDRKRKELDDAIEKAQADLKTNRDDQKRRLEILCVSPNLELAKEALKCFQGTDAVAPPYQGLGDSSPSDGVEECEKLPSHLTLDLHVALPSTRYLGCNTPHNSGDSLIFGGTSVLPLTSPTFKSFARHSSSLASNQAPKEHTRYKEDAYFRAKSIPLSPLVGKSHTNTAGTVAQSRETVSWKAISQSLTQERTTNIEDSSRLCDEHHNFDDFREDYTDSGPLGRESLLRVLLNTRPKQLVQGMSATDAWSYIPPPDSYWQAMSLKRTMKLETAIAQMIYRLLHYCLSQISPGRLDINLPEGDKLTLSKGDQVGLVERAYEMSIRLKRLACLPSGIHVKDAFERLPYPRYRKQLSRRSNDEYLGFSSTVKGIDPALQEILCSGLDMANLFTNLCQFFLTTEIHPDTNLFNFVILQLSHLQYFGAARFVFDAMVRAGVRTNEVTASAMLNLYVYSHRHSEFRRLARQIDVEDGDGLLLADTTATITPENKHQFVISYSHKLNALSGSRGHAPARVIYTKMPRTPEMYEGLIIGWANGGSLSRALTEYVSMVASGLKPTTRVLVSLMSHSIWAKDWAFGNLLWKEIARDPKIDELSYYWMLQLCASCQKHDEFSSVVGKGVEQGRLSSSLKIDNFQIDDAFIRDLRHRAHWLDCLQQNVRVPGLDPTQLPTVGKESAAAQNLHQLLGRMAGILTETKLRERGGQQGHFLQPSKVADAQVGESKYVLTLGKGGCRKGTTGPDQCLISLS